MFKKQYLAIASALVLTVGLQKYAGGSAIFTGYGTGIGSAAAASTRWDLCSRSVWWISNAG